MEPIARLCYVETQTEKQFAIYNSAYHTTYITSSTTANVLFCHCFFIDKDIIISLCETQARQLPLQESIPDCWTTFEKEKHSFTFKTRFHLLITRSQ